MDSETFVGSSPTAEKRYLQNKLNEPPYKIKDYNDYASFKKEVFDLLTPGSLQKNCIKLALPMPWYDIINQKCKSKNIKKQIKIVYLTLKKIEKILFPPIRLNWKLINISPNHIRNHQISFAIWLELFQLPLNLQKCLSSTSSTTTNKLDYIQSLIFKYLSKSGVDTLPFTMVLSYSTISMNKIKQINEKISVKISHKTHSNHNNTIMFTLHLQDMQTPFILMWANTDNICSFNVQALVTPEARAHFANTLVVFLNFTLQKQQSIRCTP